LALIQDAEQQESANPGKAFLPLGIPPPNATQIEYLQSYRMPESQYAAIRGILALFNGTHNWHNYIPNSIQDDPRNFMRVHRVDMAPLEVHDGMEWVRIKLSAHVFAKFQVRKMMGIRS
jgi:tRNA U38,U39,U40 pseudouridine synthase TruA